MIINNDPRPKQVETDHYLDYSNRDDVLTVV